MFCKIIGPSSDICKLPEVPKTFDELQRVVLKKFSHEIPDKFSLKYKDSDEELITVSNDDDLQTAILTNQDTKTRTLRVFVFPVASVQGTQGGKTGPRPPSPAMESSQKINYAPKIELKAEEPYIGQLDYISSDPGKVLEESADLRTIYEQLPPMMDLRRSVSHNPQMELQKNKDNMLGGNYFGRREFLESPVARMMSPIIPEEVVLSGHFNEAQIKAIMGAVEKKVKEQIEDKIKAFSDQILGKFQEEVWNMNMMSRSSFEFGNRGMLASVGSKMNMKRGKEMQGDPTAKHCNVCGVKIYGILYNCLVCQTFVCCEKCENKVEHEHPLLKIRPPKGAENSKNDINFTIGDRSYNGVDPQAQRLLNMLKRTSSYIENSSHMSTADRRGHGSNMEPLPGLIKAAASQYVPRPDREQGNAFHFGHGNLHEHVVNKPFLKSSTVAVLEPPVSNLAGGGSPTSQNHNKLLGYKVALVKPPLYEVTTVKAGYPYNITFTLKNNGEFRWPESTKLVCVEGIHKGSDIPLPALGPGESHVVELHLEAPWDLGRYFNEWKVHYTKDGGVKSFGKEVSIEIDVVDKEQLEREKAKKEKHDRMEKEKEAKQVEKNTVINEDHKLMKEFGCSEQTLKNARVLQDLMCNGSLKEKIEFINSCKKEWDLNQIVSAYMSSPTKLKDMIGGHSTPN